MDNQPMESNGKDVGEVENEKATSMEKCPGWPGYNVFRLVVGAVSKVESIIGHEGELVKKMCKETNASVRVLEAPLFSPDRIVLIFGKEEPEMLFSPAMDAAVRVFKRVAGLSSDEGDVAVSTFCSIRLLVAYSQATDLIGKQGSTIKSIRDASHASIRVLSEVPFYATSDERIVEIHGKALNVLKGLEAVLGRLRKFLVDQSVIPIFEQIYNAKILRERPIDAWADKTQSSPHFAFANQTGSLPLKLDPLNDGETELEDEIPPSGVSLDAQDDGIAAIRSNGVIGAAARIVPQVTQRMQVPLSYAVDIIGDDGSNIAYIRGASQASVTVQVSEDLPDEMITVEIKGTFSQVHIAQQLIEDFTRNHEEPAASINDNKVDTALSGCSQLPEITSTSSFALDIKGDGPPSDEEGSGSSSCSNNLGAHS
ncbi:hypothetical protein DITRI_Ditri10aG0145800 [Diplodiscus trichospermus]